MRERSPLPKLDLKLQLPVDVKYLLLLPVVFAVVGCAMSGTSATFAPPPPAGAPITVKAVPLQFRNPRLITVGDTFMLAIDVTNPSKANTDTLALSGVTVGGTQCVGMTFAKDSPIKPIAFPIDLEAGYLGPTEAKEMRFALPKDYKPGADLKVKISMEYPRSKKSAGYEGTATF